MQAFIMEVFYKVGLFLLPRLDTDFIWLVMRVAF